LTDPEKRDKIIEIINQEEGIAMAVDTLINITKDEIEFARMTTLIKSELDWRSGMADAENKGRREANIENARRMKADNMSISQISKYTGLSTETIAQL
jgi:predicted transposase YdaD